MSSARALPLSSRCPVLPLPFPALSKPFLLFPTSRFWTSHRGGITASAGFGVWPVSPSSVFLPSIHVVRGFGTSFRSVALGMFPCVAVRHPTDSSTFPLSGDHEGCRTDTHIRVSTWTWAFSSLGWLSSRACWLVCDSPALSEQLPDCFSKWLPRFAFPPAAPTDSDPSASSPAPPAVGPLDSSPTRGCVMSSKVF